MGASSNEGSGSLERRSKVGEIKTECNSFYFKNNSNPICRVASSYWQDLIFSCDYFKAKYLPNTNLN